MIKIIYNSPAVPQEPYNFNIGTVYDCEKSKGKYFVINGDVKKTYSLEFIKMMFKPCEEYSWDMLEEKQTEEKATKKVAKSVKQ